MKAALFTGLLWLSLAAGAQNVTLRTYLYYGIDSFELTQDHYKRLDKLADTIKKLELRGIMLRGNTDADADSVYNMRLSFRRVTEVKKYLNKLDIDTSLIKYNYYGETKPIGNNETDEGKQKNRRVDVIVSAAVPKPDTVGTIRVKLKDTCEGDTLIWLNERINYKVNRCDYFLIRDCLGISDTVNNQRALADSVPDLDKNGNPVSILGVIRVANCGNGCFTNPIVVRQLIPGNCAGLVPRDVFLSFVREDGKADKKNSKFKIVKEGNNYYYEYEILCPGLGQLCWTCGGCYKRDIKFKLKGGNKIVKLEFIDTCPRNYAVIHTPSPTKAVWVNSQFLYRQQWIITYTNKNGDTLVYNSFDNNLTQNNYLNDGKLSKKEKRERKVEKRKLADYTYNKPGKLKRRLTFWRKYACGERKFPYVFLPKTKVVVRKRDLVN